MYREYVDQWEKLKDDYSLLRQCIVIDRAALSREIIEHGEHHRKASENWVHSKRLRARAIREKATVWAASCADARRMQTSSASDEGGPKCTDKSVEQEVRQDTEYLRVCEQLDDLEELVGLYDELSKRFHGRGFMLGDLVQVHMAGNDRDYVKDERGPRRTYQGAERRVTPETDDDEAPARRRRYRDNT